MSGTSKARAKARALGRYINRAAELGAHWKVPAPLVLCRMIAARFRFGRDPDEFDREGFARRPVNAWHDSVRNEELHSWQKRAALNADLRYHKDKLVFARHCAAHELPTPAPLAILSGKAVDDPLAIGSADALAALLAERGEFDGFAKPLDGLQGHGAFGFTVRAGTLESHCGIRTPDELFSRCTQGQFADGGYLLQERIQPHPDLLPLMPGPGLGTLRIKTFLRRDGSVFITMPILKVPAAGSEVDNFRKGSQMALVDLETGVILNAIGEIGIGGGRTVTGEVERHPETGAIFTGTKLPCWPDVRRLVERAARAFSMLPALGWDIAISPDGPTLVETNWFFGLTYEEALTGRGGRAHYRELYNDLAAPVMPS